MTLAVEAGDIIKYVVTSLAIAVGIFIALLIMRRKPAATTEDASKPPAPTATPPAAVDPAMMTPAAHAPEPLTAPRPESKPQAQTKPATLQVEALAPSMTDESPMLGAEEDELKMGTDELPKFGTSEMPRVGTSEVPALADGGTYRTSAAKQLSEAISSGNCPKCKAPTFVGAETSQGDGMFKLEARCGACGHKASLLDMKV